MTDKTPEALANETMLTGVQIGNGTMEIGLQGGACAVLADAFADQFAESGAENYLEMTCTTNDKSTHPGISFVVTLRRADRKTPHQLRAEAEAKLAQAHQRIEELEKALREVCDCLDTYQQGDAWEKAQDLLSTTQPEDTQK